MGAHGRQRDRTQSLVAGFIQWFPTGAASQPLPDRASVTWCAYFKTGPVA